MSDPGQANRRRVLVAIAIAMAAVFAVTEWLGVKARESTLAVSRGELAEVREKLAVIAKLQAAPQVAALRLDSPAQITNRIAAALDEAAISPASLLAEQPLDPQRLGRTDFEVRSVIIELAPTSLPKLLAFCDALRENDSGTLVSGLVLSEPNASNRSSTGGSSTVRGNRSVNQVNSGNGELWKAEMTLTQMIYSPKSDR